MSRSQYRVEFVDMAGQVDSAGNPPTYEKALALIDLTWRDGEASNGLREARVYFRGRLQETYSRA